MASCEERSTLTTRLLGVDGRGENSRMWDGVNGESVSNGVAARGLERARDSRWMVDGAMGIASGVARGVSRARTSGREGRRVWNSA